MLITCDVIKRFRLELLYEIVMRMFFIAIYPLLNRYWCLRGDHLKISLADVEIVGMDPAYGRLHPGKY